MRCQVEKKAFRDWGGETACLYPRCKSEEGDSVDIYKINIEICIHLPEGKASEKNSKQWKFCVSYLSKQLDVPLNYFGIKA